MLNETFSTQLKTLVINMDNYYDWSALKTTAPFTGVEYPDHNHPSAVDVQKILNDISTANADIIFVEGIFAFYFAELREKFDLKIYVDLQSDERLYRRMTRAEAYEPHEKIAHRYLDTVRYRHDEFVEPTRWYADIILNGTFGKCKGVPAVVAYIKANMAL